MKNKVFIERYKRLPRANKAYAKIRDAIIVQTGVTISIFYNWQQGITEIPDHHKPTIAQIIGIPQSELFPEETPELFNTKP